MRSLKLFLVLCIFSTVVACDNSSWNKPHKHHANKNTSHASFSEQPKTLDPARAYNANETIFIAQIYEPPLQYHYLKRPYELITLTATNIPTVKYLDKNNKALPADAADKDIAYSVYDISIKPGILYQPHPAFVKDSRGKYSYHHLQDDELNKINDINDFKKSATRELIAEDYVYQIKRLANPEVQSPIFGLMSKYIIGLAEYNKVLTKFIAQDTADNYVDLRQIDFAGAMVLDRYSYRVKLKGKYQQFMYWLAMPFFAPMPWEADLFYHQEGLRDKNITLDWFPVGTGPYMLKDNNPNRQMLLEKNQNYREDYYPNSDEKIPFIDRYQFSLEKESIPRWSKFLQGYYDQSVVSSDNFDQAVQVDSSGEVSLTPELQQRHLQLKTTVSPGIYYLGFNMLDLVVGGDSDSAKKLRQAISIIVNFEEYISIFLNGRGVIAHGPIPTGIFGYTDAYNPTIYKEVDGQLLRKSIAQAKQLLAEAGYPDGRDAKTGKPLILYFDTPGAGPDSKAMFAWLTKQFDKLGIQLQVRATQYNRFQEKMRTGNAQMFMWGWLADYPDPENFLFLLYGPNGKVKFGGENASNYSNPKFDSLFDQMKNMPNGVERQAVINQMLSIVQQDAPWAWGYFPKNFQLSHQWLSNNIPNGVANNTLKYQKLDYKLRNEKQKQWNKPLVWPIFGLLFLVLLAIVPVSVSYWRKQYQNNKKES